MKAKLITEHTDMVQINENKETNEIFVEGVFSTANLKNKNGRRYKKETLNREVTKLQEMIKNKRLFGELDHPKSPEINLDRVAIMIEKMEWKGDDLVGRAKVLNTPTGRIAQEIIRASGAIGISSRGLGNVNEDGYVDDKSYKLITYDLVGNPSNGPSWVGGILESKTFEIEGEEDITKENAQKEYKKHILSLLEKMKNKI